MIVTKKMERIVTKKMEIIVMKITEMILTKLNEWKQMKCLKYRVKKTGMIFQTQVKDHLYFKFISFHICNFYSLQSTSDLS